MLLAVEACRRRPRPPVAAAGRHDVGGVHGAADGGAHLFLPSATTIAVHQALVDDVFSAFGIGLPLCWVAVFVAGLGTTWLALAVVGLFLLLVAAELALWMEKVAFLGLQTSTAHTTIINH